MSRTLSLVRLRPDREAFARWAAERRVAPADADQGYAWHALLKAAFVELAPQPFVDRITMQSNEVLGYVAADPAQVQEGLRRFSSDALACTALGLSRLQVKDMPSTWSCGRELSFEVRTRPVVRSRTNARSGAIDEIDVAPHRAQREPGIAREQAYLEWLGAQLARDDAAELMVARMHAFSRTRVARRTSGDSNGRRWATVEGPDAWLRGRLRVNDPGSFDALLRRGIGRHRAFGFGCLLIAPPGVLE
jgi:CRISPR system Cascade subunit CasE